MPQPAKLQRQRFQQPRFRQARFRQPWQPPKMSRCLPRAQARLARPTPRWPPPPAMHPRPPLRNRMFDFAAARGSGDSEKEPMTTMGFLDHLEELRKRIVYSIIAVAVGFGACWWKAEWLYGFM